MFGYENLPSLSPIPWQIRNVFVYVFVCVLIYVKKCVEFGMDNLFMGPRNESNPLKIASTHTRAHSLYSYLFVGN